MSPFFLIEECHRCMCLLKAYSEIVETKPFSGNPTVELCFRKTPLEEKVHVGFGGRGSVFIYLHYQK